MDMNANLGIESDDPAHAPQSEGFKSLNESAHHNCGHDGHTAIGLALAPAIAARCHELHGELRLIFQPAGPWLENDATDTIRASILLRRRNSTPERRKSCNRLGDTPERRKFYPLVYTMNIFGDRPVYKGRHIRMKRNNAA